MNRYLDELERTGNSLMIYKGGHLIFQSSSKGISPHLEALESLGQALHGSVMADKIVGRAAALLIVHSGAAEAHAALVSTPGRQVLEQHGLAFTYAKETPHIKMENGRIYCPFEAMVQGISDPAEAYRAIAEKMRTLKGHP